MNNQQIALRRSLRAAEKKHAGAVLIVSLIMLLLLTLIGTTSMQSTSLEEKMVGNMRDQNIAFQRAEAALRAGEAEVASTVATLPGFNCTGIGGYYDSTTETACAQLPYWQTIDWTDANKTVTYSVDGMRYSYYIEKLDEVNDGCAPCEVNPLDGSTAPTKWYRITARGAGNADNTLILLQSTYTTQ